MIASRNPDKLEAGAKEITAWQKAGNSHAKLEKLQCNIRKEEEVRSIKE